MKPHRILPLLPLLFSVALPSAFAFEPCNDACQALVREGQALQAQGRGGEAYNKFKAASGASPGAALPASSAAGLMVSMSLAAKPEQAEKLRAGARDMANQAARMEPGDPVAMEVLRQLDDPPFPLHEAAPETAAIRSQAEVLFAQQRYPDALKKYEEVMRADPQYSMAWIGAGDCWFMQKDWARAEAMFRRAGEIEPRNGQAWRFLADALAAQGKRDAAENALLSGIAADPSQRPSWSKLASLRASASLPLKPLQLRRGSHVAQGADGKYQVSVDDWALKAPETPDAALRLTLALVEVNRRNAAAGKPLDAFEVELDAWRTALKVVGELKAKDGKALTDPALLKMQALANDGQLELAILLLAFRQAYRPALESWSAAHPGGIKAFIDRYGLQP